MDKYIIKRSVLIIGLIGLIWLVLIVAGCAHGCYPTAAGASHGISADCTEVGDNKYVCEHTKMCLAVPGHLTTNTECILATTCSGFCEWVNPCEYI